MSNLEQVGEFIVRGRAIEDIVTILCGNGYATSVFTPVQPITTNINDIEHRVRVYKAEGTNNESR